VNKFGYMLETPVYPVVLDHVKMISENPSGADNQQERPDSSSGILRDYTPN
jgi:hypothetical protein